MSGQDPLAGGPSMGPQSVPQPQPRPPRPKEPSRLRVVGAVLLVLVLVLSAVFATIVLGNLSSRFAVLGQSDKDGDGAPDDVDAFPTDPWEWSDSDHDGLGDNSDPFPLDHDNDGFNDNSDLYPGFDAALRVSLDTAKLVDKPDPFDTDGEVA
ncbi:MAG TPA: hypothetical protein VMS79_02130, partial [Methanomassiliicoccales archaeon]|nr:hypothetical protein [Methanomassiliicoccales archaeon]